MFTLELLQYALLVLLAVSLGVFFSLCIYIYYKHAQYRHLPGPKRSSFFFGNVSEVRPIYEKNVPFVQVIWELQQKYGPVFAFYFFHKVLVFINDPTTVKTLLMNNIHTKPETYDLFYDLYGTRFLGRGLLTERNHEKWHERRKIFNPAFHRKELIQLMGYFNTSSDKLVLKLKRDADTGKSVPLMDGLCRATLDVIAKAGFGMEQELILEDSRFIDAIETSLRGMLHKFQRPFDWMNPAHWKKRKVIQEAVQFLREYGKALILKTKDDSLSRDQHSNNILSNIMKHFQQSGGSFDAETMVDEFLTFFVAGQETTSNLLGFTLLELGRRPEIAKRVQDEIEAIVGHKEFVEYQDVLKMEYTSLVLKETLRLYPPASGTSRNNAHDIISCGYVIPAGTNCQLNHFVMCRMEEFFKRPLEYDPERFLRDEDQPLYAYFPFSLGTRSCIGQQFALIEARVILAKLYQNFDFKLDPTQSFEILDQLTLKPKGLCRNFIYNKQKV